MTPVLSLPSFLPQNMWHVHCNSSSPSSATSPNCPHKIPPFIKNYQEFCEIPTQQTWLIAPSFAWSTHMFIHFLWLKPSLLLLKPAKAAPTFKGTAKWSPGGGQQKMKDLWWNQLGMGHRKSIVRSVKTVFGTPVFSFSSSFSILNGGSTTGMGQEFSHRIPKFGTLWSIPWKTISRWFKVYQ